MSVTVRIINPDDVPEGVWDWIEKRDYDGHPIEPWRVITCPTCGGYAVIVWAWNGGHGKHYAYRCMSRRDHQGPLIKLPEEDTWLFGQYVHPTKFKYAIDPMAV